MLVPFMFEQINKYQNARTKGVNSRLVQNFAVIVDVASAKGSKQQPSSLTTYLPSSEPSQATLPPTREPKPTRKPHNSKRPSLRRQSSSSPTAFSTDGPTESLTSGPTVEPTLTPTSDPTVEPTLTPTSDPTVEPTLTPTSDPTVEPTLTPTSDPTVEPTLTLKLSPSSQAPLVMLKPTHEPRNSKRPRSAKPVCPEEEMCG